MSLADYQPEARTITFKGGSFEVRGITLGDFSALVRTHLVDLEAVFDLGSHVLNGKVDLDDSDLTKLAVAMCEQVPSFVSNLILLASGESGDKALNAARMLSFPTQVKALFEIADVTFSEVGGVKKAVESVVGLMKDNPQALKTILTAVP